MLVGRSIMVVTLYYLRIDLYQTMKIRFDRDYWTIKIKSGYMLVSITAVGLEPTPRMFGVTATYSIVYNLLKLYF